ncbi:MAG: orotate phosphoribosyltransferase [Burkholderiaceae bacterium]|nr:MAG: orotate phosphoribosyltransferase [Burkholderiaceae bacterium]TAM04211.1 MAG: orotate phosphoribosyltransferase [Pusillimonas sp.]
MTEAYSPSVDSRTVAAALLDSGCVMTRTDEPFRLPSGWASPVYMDCRRLISFPAVRRDLVSRGLRLLQEHDALNGVAAVAGGEASGIALAAWMAEALDLPLAYVRKKQAGQTRIVGVIKPGDKVIMVDDMMAAGHSKLAFCRALAAAGAVVQDLFVVFDYGTFPTHHILDTLNVRIHALATWRDVLAVARERGDLNVKALSELEEFLHDPGRWSQAHGGIAAYRLDK